MALADGLGKKKQLMAVKKVEFGMYLGNKDERVLLPKKEVPKGLEIGDPVEVFLRMTVRCYCNEFDALLIELYP